MVSLNEQTEVTEALCFGWIIDGIKRKYQILNRLKGFLQERK